MTNPNSRRDIHASLEHAVQGVVDAFPNPLDRLSELRPGHYKLVREIETADKQALDAGAAEIDVREQLTLRPDEAWPWTTPSDNGHPPALPGTP